MAVELIIQYWGLEAYKAALLASTALLQWIGFLVIFEYAYKRWVKPFTIWSFEKLRGLMKK